MATHGAAQQATIIALSGRSPFQRKGFAMSTQAGKFSGTGRLQGEALAQYKGAENVVYTVLSYGTPIAWVTADGTVTVPADKYSVTTSHHQSLCRIYL